MKQNCQGVQTFKWGFTRGIVPSHYGGWEVSPLTFCKVENRGKLMLRFRLNHRSVHWESQRLNSQYKVKASGRQESLILESKLPTLCVLGDKIRGKQIFPLQLTGHTSHFLFSESINITEEMTFLLSPLTQILISSTNTTQRHLQILFCQLF